MLPDRRSVLNFANKKMFMKKCFLAIALSMSGALVLSAQNKAGASISMTEGRIMDGNPQLDFKPMVAEVEVVASKGKIQDVWTLTADELESRTVRGNDSATIDNLKAYGIFKSSEKNNCDIIVTPLFDIAITSQGATIRVIGFPGVFRNWSIATESDLKLAAAGGNAETTPITSPDIIKKIK